MTKRIPVSALAEVGKKFDQERVIMLSVNSDGELTHVVTWGSTKDLCAMAALDGSKLGAVLKALPDSLAEAIEAARKCRQTFDGKVPPKPECPANILFKETDID